MILRSVTLWYRKNKDGEFEFNHLELGNSDSDRPEPKFTEQETSWREGVFKKEHAWLNEQNIVVHSGRG